MGHKGRTQQNMSALIGLDNMATTVAPNEWLRTHGAENRTEVTDGSVYDVFWCPVPRGRDAPWKIQGSRCLNECHVDSDHRALVHMLQFMFLQCEVSARQGTPMPSFNRHEKTALWERYKECYCKCKMGCKGAKEEDRKFLQQYTKESPYFDPSIYTELRNKQRELSSAPVNNNNNNDNDDDDDNDGGEDDFVQLEVQRPPANPQDMDAWRERTMQVLQQNNIQQAPESLRVALEAQDEQRRVSALERQRIAQWVQLYLSDVCDGDEGDEPSVPMWPLSYCPAPPVEEVAPLHDDHADHPASCGVQPKIHVTWFALDDHNSVFRFAVLDPLLDMNFLHGDLLRNAPPAVKSGKYRRYNDESRDQLRHLRSLGQHHIANRYSESYYESILAYFLLVDNQSISYNGDRSYLYNRRAAAHLSNVLSLPRAMTIMQMARANVTPFTSAIERHRNAILYPEGVRSYTLHATQAFWHHPRYLGIAFTQWPFQPNADNFAQQLINGDARVRDGKLVFRDNTVERNMGTLAGLAQSFQRGYTHPIVDKDHIARSRPDLLGYRTGDQLMIWQSEAEAAYKHIDALYPAEPKDNPTQYLEYCKAMDRIRASGLDKFCSIWVTDGMVENKPIAESIKCVLKFLSAYLKKLPEDKQSVTCHMPMYDDDMSVWGNMVVQKMIFFRQAKTIINCVIPFLSQWGTGSMWDKKRGQPGANMAMMGHADAGKTFPFLTFVKATTIPGTWTEINSQSDKAFFVEGHIGPRIVLCDEPEKYFFSAKAEDKHYQKVQDWKAFFTSEQWNRAVLNIKTLEDGNTQRGLCELHIDDGSKWYFCTNQPRDKNHPLGTRIFQYVVPRSKIMPGDVQFDPGALFKSDVTNNFQLEQVLMCQVYTAIRIGVLRDVDMWLFHCVSTRVYEVLREWHIMDHRKGDRSRQLIESFVRYQTVVRAIYLCYHMPGGILYKHPYDPADVAKLGPFMVPTLEIIYASLHLMISELIDEEASNVLKACCKLCNFDPVQSAYINYKHRENIPFRKRKCNEDNANQQQFEKDRFKLDLNYISLSGTLQSIAARLAPYTEPQIDELQVEQTLTYLCGRPFKTEDDMCYRPEKEMDLERWVRKEMPASTFETDDDGNIVLDPHTHQPRTVDVLIAEDSLLQHCDWIMAAEYLKERKILFVCPRLINMLDPAMLDRAFNLATMTVHHPRQKVIKGFVYQEHPDLFQVTVWSDRYINEWVRSIDESSPDALCKRSEGVPLNCGEKLTQSEKDVLQSGQFNPQRQDHDTAYAALTEERSRIYRVIKDWDHEAAERVALQHGTPLDELVVYTEKHIRSMYDDYCTAHPDCRGTNSIQYPVSIIQERERDTDQRRLNTAQMVNGRTIRVASSVDEVIHHRSLAPQRPAIEQTNTTIDVTRTRRRRRF